MAGDSDFGLIGLAVMGENLALNVESRGYKVSVYNRTTEKVDEFMAGRAAGTWQVERPGSGSSAAIRSRRSSRRSLAPAR